MTKYSMLQHLAQCSPARCSADQYSPINAVQLTANPEIYLELPVMAPVPLENQKCQKRGRAWNKNCATYKTVYLTVSMNPPISAVRAASTPVPATAKVTSYNSSCWKADSTTAKSICDERPVELKVNV